MRSKPSSPPASAPNLKRCAIYTRKATPRGLEQSFNSLDAQREACLGYIDRQPGWTTAEERFDDSGFTGANTERPAFRRLLAAVDSRSIDVVVVYKVDRLGRSLLDFAKVMERFAASDVSFVSVTQNFSTAEAMGRLTLNMLMSFAEFEREMIGERTRDKIGGARRKGKWTGGATPLGYTLKEKTLVVDELDAVLVREVFSLYLEHRSPLTVACLLNERQRTTKRVRSGAGRLRGAKAFVKSGVLRILKSPVYAGYMASHGEVFEGEQEPLVDRKTWSAVQALLAGGTGPKRDHGRNPDYILRGILRCACCGSALTPASTRRGSIEYRYYRCVKKEKERRDACPSSPLPAEAIESYVVEQIREATADPSLVAEVADSVKERVGERRKDLAAERKELPGKISSLSAEGKRLAEKIAYLAGPARRLLDERLKDIGEAIQRTEARLEAVKQEMASLDAIEIDAGWVAQCLADFGSVWDVLTPANRGRLVRAIVERVEVDEPKNEVRVFLTDLQPAPSEAVA